MAAVSARTAEMAAIRPPLVALSGGELTASAGDQLRRSDHGRFRGRRRRRGRTHVGPAGELLARIERERGVPLDTRCFVNDRHGVAPTGVLYDTVVPPGKFRWVRSQDDPPVERLFVEIDDLPDAIGVSLHLDSRAISLADAESVAVGMERIAIKAATGA